MFTLLVRIRRKAFNVVRAAGRALALPCACACACLCAPRRRAFVFLVLVFLITTVTVFIILKKHLPREILLEQKLAQMQIQLEYLNTQYRARQEDLMILQHKTSYSNMTITQHAYLLNYTQPTSIAPETIVMLQKNLTGTRAGAGLNQANLKPLRIPFVYQLMPHLMDDPNSLRPAYHMTGNREDVDFVIGIPTVRRDKENYLMITLKHLLNGLNEEDANSTLIVILVGETDLQYVVGVARSIEIEYPKHVENGLIEVMSPSPGYYPNFDTIPPSLGDSRKRTKWRTKQNLDTVFLMAYGQNKGIYYLMLEDDAIGERGYLKSMKNFISTASVSNPNWVWIEFCNIGGIGKLFKSSHIPHFITYVQLFYINMPIDWLIETYLMDKVCTNARFSKQCQSSLIEIRPRYKRSLFQHIGLYSSLKGKIMKVKDQKVEAKALFYPHKNPPIELIKTNIQPYSGHTIDDAYEGKRFFWGLMPKKNSFIEFWFQKPTALESFIFRSGNAEKISDKFYESVVEVQSQNSNGTFEVIAEFDEFGLAEGKVPEHLGPLLAVRIRVLKDSSFWVILSEIFLKPLNDNSTR